MKTDKLGEWILKVSIIFILLFFLLMSLTSYQYQRMDKLIEEFDLSKVEGIIEKMDCEIKYKDFYYNGFCIDNDEVWIFLKEQYKEPALKECKENLKIVLDNYVECDKREKGYK